MAAPVLAAALTGGIATGKSYCLQRFHALGAATIDADSLAREAVRPESPGLAAVVRRFGPAVLQSDGSLNRSALGRIVFANDAARADLEAILHPLVYARIQGWLDDLAHEASTPTIAVADVPLLFETNRAGDFDRVIVVVCTPEQQRDRIMTRDGLTPDEADRRIAAQWTLDQKRRLADFVIDTSGDFADTDRQIDDVWSQLTSEPTG